jgi:uncharacterized membrane protein
MDEAADEPPAEPGGAAGEWLAAMPPPTAKKVHERLQRIEQVLEGIQHGLAATGQPVGREFAALLPAWRRRTAGEQRAPAAIAILGAILLQVSLPQSMTPLEAAWSRWLLPGVEAVLLVVLLVANPRRIERDSAPLRLAGITLLGVASLSNASSAVRLVLELVHGHGPTDGAALLAAGGAIWLTNVIVFALWYWELDRKGPASRAAGAMQYPDLLFPQMATPGMADPSWEPRFVDYLYVSFTNAAAFSPTDTLPLTHWAKLVFTLQSMVSLSTAALIVARAVNILA